MLRSPERRRGSNTRNVKFQKDTKGSWGFTPKELFLCAVLRR